MKSAIAVFTQYSVLLAVGAHTRCAGPESDKHNPTHPGDNGRPENARQGKRAKEAHEVERDPKTKHPSWGDAACLNALIEV
jgi:hypothetical protein